MSKRQTLILLGVWVMLLQAFGLPPSVKTVIAVATGFIIVMVAYRMKPSEPDRAKDADAMTYVESNRQGSQPVEASRPDSIVTP